MSTGFGAARSSRRRVLGTVFVLLAVPALLVPIEAAQFYLRNRATDSIRSSGQTREYVLYVPASYDSTTATPLVISLHGAGMWGAAQRETSRWDEVADDEGVIVVYPSGDRSHGGPRVWQVAGRAGLMDNVRFIADLIDTLEAQYNIDPRRIYANGLSDGGGMAFVLSCTLSDRIAAVGMVGAAQTLEWDWCPDDRPVPMIAFHGTADPIVPYEGGSVWMFPDPWPDVRRWVANWARRNRCGSEPVASTVAADVTRHAYAACAGGATVVLYTIVGGGHTWPGGTPLPDWFAGPTRHSVRASQEMWDFFRRFQLPPAATPEP